MKIQKKESTDLTFGVELYTNVYVSSYANNVEITLQDVRSDGSEYHLSLTLPLDKARSLAKELSNDLEQYDEEVAKREAAEVEEE